MEVILKNGQTQQVPTGIQCEALETYCTSINNRVKALIAIKRGCPDATLHSLVKLFKPTIYAPYRFGS